MPSKGGAGVSDHKLFPALTKKISLTNQIHSCTTLAFEHASLLQISDVTSPSRIWNGNLDRAVELGGSRGLRRAMCKAKRVVLPRFYWSFPRLCFRVWGRIGLDPPSTSARF
jgi:hypothetical protein